MKSLRILGFNINTSLDDFVIHGNSIVVNTINPHSYNVTKTDPLFREALEKSDVLIPDGIGIVMAAQILNGSKIRRITGADLHKYILQKVNQESGKVFYLGSTTGTLKLIEHRVKLEYTNIEVASFSPPFKPEFTEKENSKMVAAINEFHPDVVFVGMTAPKQEKWAYQHQDVLNTKIIASVGAVFDFYAGTIERAPHWMIGLGLEWFYRLIKEPKRMWRRYLIGNVKFIFYILKEKIYSK